MRHVTLRTDGNMWWWGGVGCVMGSIGHADTLSRETKPHDNWGRGGEVCVRNADPLSPTPPCLTSAICFPSCTASATDVHPSSQATKRLSV